MVSREEKARAGGVVAIYLGKDGTWRVRDGFPFVEEANVENEGVSRIP